MTKPTDGLPDDAVRILANNLLVHIQTSSIIYRRCMWAGVACLVSICLWKKQDWVVPILLVLSAAEVPFWMIQKWKKDRFQYMYGVKISKVPSILIEKAKARYTIREVIEEEPNNESQT